MPAREFFEALPTRVDPERLDGVEHTYLFTIEGEGQWLVEVENGALTVTENPDRGADVEFVTSGETFERLASRAQNPMTAYMTGKLKINGDLKAALQLQQLF